MAIYKVQDSLTIAELLAYRLVEKLGYHFDKQYPDVMLGF